MPRVARLAPGGFVYHVLNRGVGKMTLCATPQDFQAFQGCLLDTLEVVPMRILAYCVMSNHWHLLLWPRQDGDLARFMLRLTITHVRRWLEYRHEVGSGHVYQGRYKSFPIQDDGHLLTVCRYVERNPLRAGLVKSCGQWPYSSAGQARLPAEWRVPLTDLPVARRKDWAIWLDEPQTAAEEQAVGACLKTGVPFGAGPWKGRFATKFGWRDPLQRGRPRKPKKARRMTPPK